MYFEAEDSALKSAATYEHLTRTPENTVIVGNEIFEEEIFKIEDIPISHIEHCFEYSFNNDADGVIDFTLCLEDESGNKCEKTVSLIKDSVVDIGSVNSSNMDHPILSTSNSNKTVEEALSDPALFVYELNEKKIIYPCWFSFPANTSKPFITDMNGKKYYDSDEWKVTDIVSRFDDENEPLKYNFTQSNDTVKIDGTVTKTLNAGTDTNPIVFKKDPYEDLFISVLITDGAGNIYEHTMNLYKSLDIVQIFYDSNEDQFELTLNKKIAENASPKIYSAVPGDSLNAITSGYTSYDKNKGLAFTKIITINNNKIKPSALTAGTYQINIAGAGKAYLSNPYYIIKDSTGNFSFSKKLEPDNSIILSESHLPSFSVTADTPEHNKAKRNIHILYDDSFNPVSDLTYLINAYHDDIKDSEENVIFKKKSYFTTQTDFELENHLCKWNFKIYVYDDTGNYICTKNSDIKTLDLSFDNIPPKCSENSDQYIHYPEKTVIPDFKIKDIGSELKKEKDKIVIEYFFSNQDYSINTNQIDWDTYSSVKKLLWDGNDLVFNREGTNLSFLYFRTSDIYSNYLETKIKLPELKYIENPQYDYNNNTLTVAGSNIPAISLSNDEISFISNSDYEKLHADYLTKDSDENFFWKPIGDETTISLTNEQFCSFLRIFLFKDNSIISSYLYLYPEYYFSDLTSELQDIVSGIRGVNVFTNQDCFIHTYYITQPDLSLKNNIDYWINNAIELRIQKKNTNFTYHLPENIYTDYKDNYYVNIIHFFNGTTIMTDIKTF